MTTPIKISEIDELGPDNKEARQLMSALQKAVDTSLGLDFSSNDNLDNEEIWNNCGIGKDHLGKFAFADIKDDGKYFRVTLRNKEDLEHEDKKFNSLVNSVSSDRNLN